MKFSIPAITMSLGVLLIHAPSARADIPAEDWRNDNKWNEWLNMDAAQAVGMPSTEPPASDSLPMTTAAPVREANREPAVEDRPVDVPSGPNAEQYLQMQLLQKAMAAESEEPVTPSE